MESYNTHNSKPHKPNSTGGGGGRHEASASPTDLFSSAQVLAGAAMSTFRHESAKVDKSEAAAAADNLLHAVSQYGHLEEKSYGKYIDKAEGYLHKYSAPSQPPSHGSGPTKKYQQEQYEEEEEEEYNTGHKPSYGRGKVKKQQEEEYEYEQYNNAGHKPSYASGKVKKQQQEEEYEDDDEEYASHKTSARPNSYASGKTKKHQEEEEEESGGGIGDYMKLAQGFMKSQGGGGGGGHSSGGGESEGAGIGDYMKLAQGFLGKR